jgi:hypothetical protein
MPTETRYHTILYRTHELLSKKPTETRRLILADLTIVCVSVTKVRTLDGDIVKVGIPEHTFPLVQFGFSVKPRKIDDLMLCETYINNVLSTDYEYIPELNRDLLAEQFTRYAMKLFECTDANRKSGFKKHNYLQIAVKLELTKEVIIDEGILLRGLKKMVPEDNDDNDKPSCAICLEDLSDACEYAKTLCSHDFHRGCIVQWLAKHNTCPNCRRIICPLTN